jgi:hypothetical protein
MVAEVQRQIFLLHQLRELSQLWAGSDILFPLFGTGGFKPESVRECLVPMDWHVIRSIRENETRKE